MLRTEIIRTCSNEAVATAALRSLGHVFYSRIALIAGAHCMQPGPYAACLVRRFSEDADEKAWHALDKAMVRRDMPVLAGFKFILENMIDGEEGATVKNRPSARSCGGYARGEGMAA